MSPVTGINNTIVATPLPALLRDAGYHTIHVGKAHFAPYGTPAADPIQIGFQENVAGTAAGHPGSFLAADQYRGNASDTFWAVRDLEKHIAEGEFLTDALTHAALEKLDAVKPSGRPFFLYLSHYAVHVPLSKDERFYSKYIEKGLDDKEARFAALVEGMDKSLGDLLNYLDRNGLSDNTHIVFMSDNGSLSLVPARGGKAFTHNLPLKQGKGSLYEGGIRVPLLVAGPGIPAGKKQDQYVAVHDFFPTILEWAGIRNPTIVQQVDGQSIVPFLQNPEKMDSQRMLIWHYPNNWTNINVKGTSWGTAIRKGKFKLIYFHKTGELELYDLEKDLAEQNDLSRTMPKKLKEMALLMTAALQSRKAPMPVVKTSGKQIPWPSDLIKNQ
jgi:arylsulfatase A-like enzyme